MAKKITFRDIAALAGVGTATVERVLNGRGGVGPETTEKVVAAVRQLDYPKRLPERHRGVLRIEVVLVRPETEFYARLSKSFERIAATLDASITVHRTFLEEADPVSIARYLEKPGIRRAGLILSVPEHPAIRAALQALRAQNIPVVQIVTQSAEGDYVGIDNEAAGRMAGLLMAGMQRRAGSVIALCHSQIYAVHRDRARGFSDYFARKAPEGLAFKGMLFTQDEARSARERVREALKAHADLAGIYNVGGANPAICEELELHRPKDICFIGHELTEQSRAALKSGIMAAVIDQAPATQARRALDTVLRKLGLLQEPVDGTPIPFITLTAENV